MTRYSKLKEYILSCPFESLFGVLKLFHHVLPFFRYMLTLTFKVLFTAPKLHSRTYFVLEYEENIHLAGQNHPLRSGSAAIKRRGRVTTVPISPFCEIGSYKIRQHV